MRRNIKTWVVAYWAVALVSVNGHGNVIGPFQPRNVAFSNYCAHCANGPLPCGNGPSSQWNSEEAASLVNGKYTTTLNEIKAGQVLDMKIRITAAHKGHFIMDLCRPTEAKITHECFTYRLERDPTDTTDFPFHPKDPTAAFFTDNACVTSRTQSVRYIVPEDIEPCDHCILRFYWQTGNSCSAHALDGDALFQSWTNPEGCKTEARHGSGTSCGKSCPTPQCNHEQFRNCIDVRITSDKGDGSHGDGEGDGSHGDGEGDGSHGDGEGDGSHGDGEGDGSHPGGGHDEGCHGVNVRANVVARIYKNKE